MYIHFAGVFELFLFFVYIIYFCSSLYKFCSAQYMMCKFAVSKNTKALKSMFCNSQENC
jgi:hypothetical protein